MGLGFMGGMERLVSFSSSSLPYLPNHSHVPPRTSSSRIKDAIGPTDARFSRLASLKIPDDGKSARLKSLVRISCRHTRSALAVGSWHTPIFSADFRVEGSVGGDRTRSRRFGLHKSQQGTESSLKIGENAVFLLISTKYTFFFPICVDETQNTASTNCGLHKRMQTFILRIVVNGYVVRFLFKSI